MGQVSRASQERRICAEKNVRKRGICGLSATAAGSLALTEKFRMTFEGRGARSSKHSLGVGEDTLTAGRTSVQRKCQTDGLPATWASTLHPAGGRGLRMGPGRGRCRSRQPQVSHQEKPKGTTSNVLDCLISRKMTKLLATGCLSPEKDVRLNGQATESHPVSPGQRKKNPKTLS